MPETGAGGRSSFCLDIFSIVESKTLSIILDDVLVSFLVLVRSGKGSRFFIGFILGLIVGVSIDVVTIGIFGTAVTAGTFGVLIVVLATVVTIGIFGTAITVDTFGVLIVVLATVVAIGIFVTTVTVDTFGILIVVLGTVVTIGLCGAGGIGPCGPCGPCGPGKPGSPVAPGGIINPAGIFIPPAKLSLISSNNFITPSS